MRASSRSNDRRKFLFTAYPIFAVSNRKMKKLFSTTYSATAFNVAILVLRAGISITMIHHGYNKLTHFSEMQEKFMNFMGLGTDISLGLAIFAEFFCSILLLIGLATRVALIPMIITMAVAVFSAHSADIFGKGELATLYLLAYIALLLVGPGAYSVDGILNRE
jgi:putative oxidoreductase